MLPTEQEKTQINLHCMLLNTILFLVFHLKVWYRSQHAGYSSSISFSGVYLQFYDYMFPGAADWIGAWQGLPARDRLYLDETEITDLWQNVPTR